MSDPGRVRELLHQHGGKSAAGLVTLILLLQNAGVLPSAQELVKGRDDTSAKLERHLEQSKNQARQLDAIRGNQEQMLNEQRATRSTTAQGFRILCLQGAKTETQRDRCLDIQ